MSREKISNAIGHVYSHYIQEAAEYSRSIPIGKRIGKYIALAACFALMAFAVPLGIALFGKTNMKAPPTFHYETIEKMHEALGRETLYSDNVLAIEGGQITDVLVSYMPDENWNAILEQPSQALISQKIDAYTLHYYILFGKNNTEDSYIAGYEEQNLSLTINGITVQYSETSEVFGDGYLYESQGRFVYEGDLYVVHVLPSEKQIDVKSIIMQIIE